MTYNLDQASARNAANDARTELARIDWKYLLTSFDGRIGRQHFWFGVAALLAVNIAASIILMVLARAVPASLFVAYPLSLVMLYPAMALNAKRWHDRGMSGWWSLVILVPIAGPIYALVQLGFLPAAASAENKRSR